MKASNCAALVLTFCVSVVGSLYVQQPVEYEHIPAKAEKVDEPLRPVTRVALTATPEPRTPQIAAPQQRPVEHIAVSWLDDPDAAVREDAIEALAEKGGSAAIVGLGYALSDERSLVRRMAIEALLDIGDDEAIGTLAVALDEVEPDLRKLAVDDLGEIDTDASTLLLQRFLADTNAAVREAADEHLRYR